MILRATYRLQLHAGFTFADAEAIVPYLADLGISHVYASPITTAAKGSTHGYDVIDPTRINPELGGEEGLLRLVAALKACGMGLIIDIVPNHMGVAGDENAWWLDVLEHGQASAYAPVFDINWSRPVMLPVLGTPLAEALESGAIKLAERDGKRGVQLYDGPVYPLRPDIEDDLQLAELLDRQHYRLLYWRAANDSLNWRRFFAINELAGVRIEDPAVFERTHALYFDLYRRGLIDGVRIDHVDGLTDPEGYCRALRARFDAIRPDAYIVVEKILAPGEHFASQRWGIHGTSGYDFMREVSELLHDPASDAPLRALWHAISGRSPSFAPEVFEAKRDILAWQFEGQLRGCVQAFRALAQAEGRDWITEGMLRRAAERLLWVFPVYRTYGTGAGAPPEDKAVRQQAREAALPLMPPGEAPVLDLLLGWLAGEGAAQGAVASEAVRRFQQLSAPIAAKGVEDTAFYRHTVLLSANDVGFEPQHFARSIADFHAAMQARAERHPYALLATATHDHKRGEDARARLAVLSAVPDEWAAAVRLWTEQAGAFAEGIDPADLYALFQTLVGAWEGDGAELLPRVQEWQRKALREAKLRSSWEAPDEDYEGRYAALAESLLTGREGAPFREAFARFLADLAAPALANTLAQTALRYTAPGVPDLYQGCELMDFSLVDPDNRRPVDYALRRRVLAGGKVAGGGEDKLHLIAGLLARRTGQPALADGGYRPLPVTGAREGHVIAFARGDGAEAVRCGVAIRLGAVLFGQSRAIPDPQWWGDTHVDGIPATELFHESVVAFR